MTVEDFAEENAVDVWPDNAAAVSVMASMSTQWRVGPGGAYGLDYGVLPQVMRLRGIARSEWADVFDSVRVMEDAALEQIRKNQG